MCTNPAAGSSNPSHLSHGGDWHEPQQDTCGNFNLTAEECLAMYQSTNDQYWVHHGLTMNHSGLPSFPSRANTPSSSQAHTTTLTAGYRSLSASQARASSQLYRILPQQEYIAKRRYQPQAPILFRASPAVGYVRLSDFYSSHMAGGSSPLENGEDAVFSEDNLSQKQSIRLGIHGCKPYERQINVRNPANNSRSITRRKLAEKIAKEIYDFMSRHQQTTFGDPSLGLGPGLDGFRRIVLIELRHVSRSSWQPILGVLS